MPSDKELKSIIWNEISKTSEPKIVDVEDKSGWQEVSTGPWSGRFSNDLSEERSLQYLSEGKFISFKPIIKAQSNTTALTKEREKEYRDAIGSGISLKLEFDRRTWSKHIIINSLESLGELKGKEYEFRFEVETNFELSDHPEYLKQLGKNSFIHYCRVWDSSTDEKGVSSPQWMKIDAGFIESGGKTFFYKRIPTEWLKKAVFPVYTDADITWGSSTSFESNAHSGYDAISLCTLDSDRFALAYLDSGVVTLRIGSVSGTTITLGTPSAVNSSSAARDALSVCKVDTDKVVVAYANGDDGDQGYVRAVSISGTTVGTWGTAVEFYGSACYRIECCEIDTNKFAVVFVNTSSTYYQRVCAGTVSGTTITLGSNVQIDSSTNNPYLQGICKVDTNKFVVSYTRFYVCAVSVSGTTCTAGTPVQFYSSGNSVGTSLSQLDTNKFVCAFLSHDEHGSTYNELMAFIGTVSGTTITTGSDQDSGYECEPRFLDVASISSTQFVVVFSDMDNSGRTYSMLCDVDGTSITFGTKEQVGVREAYNNSVCILSSPFVAVAAWTVHYRNVWNQWQNTGYIIAGSLPATLPTVTTQAASDVGSDSATGNGTIVSTGGPNCTKRGFVYDTESHESTLSLSDSESFESSLGDWTNDASNVSDWIRDSGGTPSSSTGPSSAVDGSYYIYVETSSGDSNGSGDTDIIKYSIDIAPGDPPKDGYVDFYYHQYGTDQGTLYLEAYDGSTWSEIWSSSGDQGNQWNHVESGTEFTGATMLRFRNVAAGGYRGDVALDLIKVYTGQGMSLDDYANKSEDTGSYAAGSFTKLLESLDAETTYYARAIAYNSEGYGYGDEIDFTTESALSVAVMYYHHNRMRRG